MKENVSIPVIIPIKKLEVVANELNFNCSSDFELLSSTYSQKHDKFAVILKDKKSMKQSLLIAQEVPGESKSTTKLQRVYESDKKLSLISRKLQSHGKHSII